MRVAGRRTRTTRSAATRFIGLLGGSWPDDALILLGDRRQPFVQEALDAFSFVCLRRVQVPLRINGDAVHAVELTWVPPTVSEGRQFFQRLAIDDLHLLVHAVRHE